MKRVAFLLALMIPLFFSRESRASEADKFAMEGSAGVAAGSLFGIGTLGGYGTLDVGLKLDHGLTLYGDATYEGTRTSDGIELHTLSAGLALLASVHRFRFGAIVNCPYTWFDRVSERASVGQFGLGAYLQGGVDLVRMETVTLSLDTRGGFILMPTATYPSIHAGISLRF